MPSVYVCCPAYGLDGPLRKARILDAIAPVATELGLTVVASPLMDRHIGPGAWLPVAERRIDLRSALQHDVVWASAGGYGSVHLVEDLLHLEAARRPWLIGYSDITVMHACWRRRAWGEGIYCALPGELGGRTGQSMLSLMRGQGYQRSGAIDAGVRVLRAGAAQGICQPACLSVLAGLCGTPAQPHLRGCVLAIEDVDERPFELDFAQMQLALSGALEGLVGLIGGNFTHKDRSDYEGPSSEEIIASWAHRLQVPSISRLPFGHIDDGLAMPSGRSVELVGGADGSWRFDVASGPSCL